MISEATMGRTGYKAQGSGQSESYSSCFDFDFSFEVEGWHANRSVNAQKYRSNKKIEPMKTKCQSYNYLSLQCKSKANSNNVWCKGIKITRVKNQLKLRL